MELRGGNSGLWVSSQVEEIWKLDEVLLLSAT